MTTQEPVSNINPKTDSSNKFHHFVGGFVINAPCIFSENNAIFVHDTYDLLDFLDNGEIFVRTVKFFHAYTQGYTVTIVVLDTKSGEMIKRKHRLNDDGLPCDWLLMEINYLNPDDKKDELLEFDFQLKT